MARNFANCPIPDSCAEIQVEYEKGSAGSLVCLSRVQTSPVKNRHEPLCIDCRHLSVYNARTLGFFELAYVFLLFIVFGLIVFILWKIMRK